MNSASAQEQKPSADAAADVRHAGLYYDLVGFITIISRLRHLRAIVPWTTAPFSVSDVTYIRRHLKTCHELLNQIESELDRRE
jgi:hypothetical protein